MIRSKSEQQISFKLVELRCKHVFTVRAQEFQCLVEHGQSLPGLSHLAMRLGLDGEKQGPEHGWGVQALVELYTLADLRQTFVCLARPDQRRTVQASGNGPPNLKLMLLCDVQHGLRAFPHEFHLPPP